MTNRLAIVTVCVASMTAAPCRASAGTPSTRAAGLPTSWRYWDTLARSFTGREVLSWPQRQVAGNTCRVSPPLTVPAGDEINHHRLRVFFTGAGTVELAVAHSAGTNLDYALAKPYLHSPFEALGSGKELLVSSTRARERCAWLLLRTRGNVQITRLEHRCWHGRGTIFGHVGRFFTFAGQKLPYRLMLPRNYDPRKAYPLVLSISGSGGIGTDNRRNMEMVILARYLFDRYYHDRELECFSLVPQIPPITVAPAPYWPKGPRGKPVADYYAYIEAAHENGWFVQATLALIRQLLADKTLNIDPDRIYYAGFSYGGRACWEFLKAGRDIFAAAICCAGWPIGRPGLAPTGPALRRLKQDVRRYKHIPVLIMHGQNDRRMRPGSQALHREILAQGGKSTYVVLPKANHVSSAGAAWGNRKYVAWLFKQNRKNNPPPGKDPFPGGNYPNLEP